MNNRFRVAAAAIFLLLVFGNLSALAHAQLKRATPEVGGTVSAPASEVLVNFSEPLEAAFSSVVVRDAVGRRVDKADAHIDPADRTTIRVSVELLNKGTYIVVWRALTADTHGTEGAFMFQVGERSGIVKPDRFKIRLCGAEKKPARP